MPLELGGCVHLSSRVLLERDTVQDDSLAIQFRAPVFSNQAFNGTRLLACRFLLFHENINVAPRWPVPDGIYDIIAVVTHASEQPNYYLTLKGEIIDLKPVLPDVHNPVFPATILASGFVRTVQKKTFSFTMTIYQHVEGGSLRDELTVVAAFEPNERWPNPAQRLPNVAGLVTVTGILQFMEHNKATILVHTITYMNQAAVPRVRKQEQVKKGRKT